MRSLLSAGVLLLVGVAACGASSGRLDRIRVSADRNGFVTDQSGATFAVVGFNYDHDSEGRLLEDYWDTEWSTVVEDFSEMKALGASVVRIHLQLGRFMDTPADPNKASLARLSDLIDLAARTGLYLDVTGLGCYHKADVPGWYDPLEEAARWQVQARFWQAVAGVGAGKTAIFCYDLMNEPIVPGQNVETEWLAGEFAGKYFVQRIALDRAGRTPEQIADAWVTMLAAAIRKVDSEALITVGVIPWALTFPGAKPLFYAETVSRNLDFVSVHFYPEAGQVDKALEALNVYAIGKPIVVEEMFPLKCDIEQMGQFMDASHGIAQGWLTFYWGKTIEQYQEEDTIPAAVIRRWLAFFSQKCFHLQPGRFDAMPDTIQNKDESKGL